MVIWKEHEHELDDVQEANNPGTMIALWECGFLKYFKVLEIKAYVRRLEHIIHMWDLDQQHFVVRTDTLNLDIEDIYFLTKLSHRGRPIILAGPRGGDSSLYDLVDRYCLLGTLSQGGKLPIKQIIDRTLSKVFYTIGKVIGTRSIDFTTREHMLYAIEGMATTIFN